MYMLCAACYTCFFSFLSLGEIIIPSDKGYYPGAILSYGVVSYTGHRFPQYSGALRTGTSSSTRAAVLWLP